MARSHREFLGKTANQSQPLRGALGVDLVTATARMNIRRIIRSFRRGSISKLFAALLVLLVVSPFTAPFATCDLTEVSGLGTIHVGNLSADKDAQKSSAVNLATVRLGAADCTSDRQRLGRICDARRLVRADVRGESHRKASRVA